MHNYQLCKWTMTYVLHISSPFSRCLRTSCLIMLMPPYMTLAPAHPLWLTTIDPWGQTFVFVTKSCHRHRRHCHLHCQCHRHHQCQCNHRHCHDNIGKFSSWHTKWAGFRHGKTPLNPSYFMTPIHLSHHLSNIRVLSEQTIWLEDGRELWTSKLISNQLKRKAFNFASFSKKSS